MIKGIFNFRKKSGAKVTCRCGYKFEFDWDKVSVQKAPRVMYIRCPKCNSENVQIQAKELKPKMIGASCLCFAGFGLMFLGIIGAIIGVAIGLIVGIILNSVMSNTYQSVMVCQNCGYVSKPMSHVKLGTEQHPLFCNPEESNLEVLRNDVDKGTIVIIRVKIDNYAPLDISDNSTTSLKVSEGLHTVSYEQINGIGKNKNRGQLSVTVSEKKSITFSFARQGLLVK
jgi:predicted Zn-ribbon and HTH transcriptional regulator